MCSSDLVISAACCSGVNAAERYRAMSSGVFSASKVSRNVVAPSRLSAAASAIVAGRIRIVIGHSRAESGTILDALEASAGSRGESDDHAVGESVIGAQYKVQAAVA